MHVLYYIFYVKDVYSLENRKLLFTSLGKGYVDAIAAHETSVQQYIKDYGAKIRILDEAILTTGIGVAFPENTDSELPEKLTEIFKEMRNTVQTADSNHRYNGGTASVSDNYSLFCKNRYKSSCQANGRDSEICERTMLYL